MMGVVNQYREDIGFTEMQGLAPNYDSSLHSLE